MTHIYAVEKGEYSDYHIVGLFTDEAIARACASATCGDVRVMMLNPHAEQWRQGLMLWSVEMDREGSTERTGCGVCPCSRVYEEIPEDSFDDFFGTREFSVWARDEAHAVKIANERRLQVLASGVKWPEKKANW